MKKITRNNSRNSNPSANVEKDTTMKRTIARNNSRNSNPSANVEKDTAMKRTIARNSSANNSRNSNPSANEKDTAMKRTIARNNSRNSEPSMNTAQILSTLKALGINADALFGNNENSETVEKSQKADRTYEIPTLGADFTKNAIYAAPKSENAGKYFNEQKALCTDTLNNLGAPIASEIKAIAERAEKDGGATLKDDLLTLANAWKIPAPAMRVIMQLCAPIVACCNPETDDIARRGYGMARANALMGSACNMLMYTKATDKEKALPFKRVAHNLTSLGLNFTEQTSVNDCDFCEDDKDFEKLVSLCDTWLAKCERIAPTPQKAGKKSASEDKKSASDGKKSASEDKNAQILALLQSLLNK